MADEREEAGSQIQARDRILSAVERADELLVPGIARQGRDALIEAAPGMASRAGEGLLQAAPSARFLVNLMRKIQRERDRRAEMEQLVASQTREAAAARTPGTYGMMGQDFGSRGYWK